MAADSAATGSAAVSTPEGLATSRAGTSRAGTRYAQLAYTSSESASGFSGGWHVTSHTGLITPDEQDTLTARIVTRFDVDPPLQAYPTPDEIAARPARLCYSTLTSATAAYWHTVDAGTDATGRPGNVFAHVLLDRDIAAASPLRPIQLWNSPDWLRPYGAADVAAATLTSRPPPAPSDGITAGSVVRFLTDTSVDRQALFRVLLDATHHAMHGGRHVVLLTDSLAAGPLWIAAISYFMPPATARRFSWCTHDKPGLAVADMRRGVQLMVVPRRHAAQLPPGPWLVIDELEDPSLGELGSAHSTARGDVVVTPWSILAEGVLTDENVATRLLAQQDAIAAELGDPPLSPSWALAVAVRANDQLAEFHGDTETVIADDAPRGSESVPWLAFMVDRAAAATAPANTEDAHARLRTAVHRGVGAQRAARHYLTRALTDPDWLHYGGVADVPHRPLVELAEVERALHDCLDLLRHRSPDPSGYVAGTALRVAELVGRLAIDNDTLAAARYEISRIIAGAGVDFLWNRDTTADLPVGITEPTMAGCLRPVIAQQRAEALNRLTVPVWRWLFGDSPQTATLPSEPTVFDRNLFPRYIRVLARHRALPDDGSGGGDLAAQAIYLAADAEHIAGDESVALSAELAHDANLSSDEIVALLRRWPGRISPVVAYSVVLYDAGALAVCQMVAGVSVPGADPRAPTPEQVVAAAAQLRCLRAAWPVPGEEALAALATAVPVVLAGLRAEHVAGLAGDLAEILAALLVAAWSRGEDWAESQPLSADAVRALGAVRTEAVTELIGDLVDAEVADVDRAIGQSLLARVGDELRPAHPAMGERWARGPFADWADVIVDRQIERGRYTGPVTVTGLRDCAWPSIRSGSAADAELFFAHYARHAREWLREHRVNESDAPRIGFRWLSREERS